MLKLSLIHFDTLDVESELGVEHPVVVRAVSLKTREVLMNLRQLRRRYKNFTGLILAKLSDDVLPDQQPQFARVDHWKRKG